MSSSKEPDEVTQVSELLSKANLAASEAAMWLSDVDDIISEAGGEQPNPAAAAQLVGMAYDVRHNTTWALKASEKSLIGLHQMYQVSDSEAQLTS